MELNNAERREKGKGKSAGGKGKEGKTKEEETVHEGRRGEN